MPPIPSSTPPDLARPLVAARDAVVLCDLSALRIIAFAGPDAATFLHGQLSSDVAGLAPDACQYTSYNTPSGRMLANFVLWRTDPDPGAGFCALLPGDIADAIRKRLAMFVLRAKVTVADVTPTVACHGAGGPGAAAALHAALVSAPPPFGVVRHGGATVLGLPGARFLVLASTAPAGGPTATLAALAVSAVPAGADVWQWLTIRAGVPTITAATQDKFVPQMANWDLLGGVNFRKGCYPGQEIVARSQYLGRLKERLFAFRAPAGTIAAGTRLYSAVFAGQPCGTVVNAASAPDGEVDLLAVVQLAAAASGDVRLGAPDGPRLQPLPLPYAVPAAGEPRSRAAEHPADA